MTHSPKCAHRMFSVSQADRAGNTVIFGNGQVQIMNRASDKVLGIGHLKGGQYWIKFATLSSSSSSSNSHVAAVKAISPELTHHCFGHLNWAAISKLHATGDQLVKGLVFNDAPQPEHICKGCALGKATRQSFSSSDSPRATAPFEHIHLDLAGPLHTCSVCNGNIYTASFINDHSDHAWVFYLKQKLDFEKVFDQFVAYVHMQHGMVIKELQSDNGGEYMSNSLQAKMKALGIIHQMTTPYTPQQNGKAEHYNQTLFEATYSLLLGAGLSEGFWEEAAHTVVHVRNRSPCQGLGWQTPWEALTGDVPDISYFCMYGCLAYATIPENKRTKLDAKAEACVFVSYQMNTKGYHLWSTHSQTIIISTDVCFNETVFFKQQPPQSSSNSSSKTFALSTTVNLKLPSPHMPAPAAPAPIQLPKPSPPTAVPTPALALAPATLAPKPAPLPLPLQIPQSISQHLAQPRRASWFNIPPEPPATTTDKSASGSTSATPTSPPSNVNDKRLTNKRKPLCSTLRHFHPWSPIQTKVLLTL